MFYIEISCCRSGEADDEEVVASTPKQSMMKENTGSMIDIKRKNVRMYERNMAVSERLLVVDAL